MNELRIIWFTISIFSSFSFYKYRSTKQKYQKIFWGKNSNSQMKISAILVQLCQMGRGIRVRRDSIGQNRLLNNLERHRAGKWSNQWSTDVDLVAQIGQWISLNRSQMEEEQWKSFMQKHKQQHKQKRCKQHGCKQRNRRRYRKYVRHLKKNWKF